MISLEKRSTNPCSLQWQYQHKCQHWGVSTRPGGRGCSWAARCGTTWADWAGGLCFYPENMLAGLVAMENLRVCLDASSIFTTAVFTSSLIRVASRCRLPPNFSVTFQDWSLVSSLYVSSGVIKDIRVYLKWRGCVMLFGIIFHYTPYEKSSVCLPRRPSSWAIQNSFAYITGGFYPPSQLSAPFRQALLSLSHLKELWRMSCGRTTSFACLEDMQIVGFSLVSVWQLSVFWIVPHLHRCSCWQTCLPSRDKMFLVFDK